MTGKAEVSANPIVTERVGSSRARPGRLRWLLILLFGAACVGGEGGESSNAGLQPNARSEIEHLPNWSLADDANVSVGVAQGAYEEEFAAIQAGVLTAHEFYLLDNGNCEVRVFDRDGRHVMSFGREGEGPAEFTNPNQLIAGPDSTLAVWDRALRRLTVFGHNGDVRRMATVREGFANPRLHSLMTDGSFILSDLRYPPPLGGAPATGTLAVILYSASGELVDTLQMLAGPHLNGVDFISPPFTTPDLVASAREGVWVLRTDTALFARLGPTGDTLQTVQWEPPDRRVTDSDLAQYEAWRVEGVDDEAERRELIQKAREFASDVHPAAVALMTDEVGRVWLVERHDWDRIQAPTWLLFDPSGQVIARLAEPRERLVILDADATHALVRVSDDLGVQRVELRRILMTPETDGASNR